MKKIYTTLVAVLAVFHFSYAQWIPGTPSGSYVLNSGYAGIGTPIPITNLDVLGSTNSGIFQITTSAQVPDLRLRQTNSVHTNTRNWSLYTNSNQYGSFEIAVSSARYLDDYTTKFLIDLNGNVGIGTTTPSRKLDILSGTGVTPFAAVGPNGYMLIDNTGAGYNYFQANYLHQFQGTSNNPIMTLLADGKVGIGTTTPQEALSVNGNIRSKQIKVELANWPDYVFKPTYTLPSLLEVKNYIDKYQHLPDMPSEAEVAKNGINLGEIVELQTKKIEELTLYLIEKDKQVTEQQKQNADRNKQLAEQQQINQSLQQQINQLAKRMNN
jgi:hypothetical protein